MDTHEYQILRLRLGEAEKKSRSQSTFLAPPYSSVYLDKQNSILKSAGGPRTEATICICTSTGMCFCAYRQWCELHVQCACIFLVNVRFVLASVGYR